MTDRNHLEDASIDLDDFYEWVVSTAEAEETSPEAIIQQLMSTYWILNELTETLEETPYEHLLDRGADDPSEDADAEADAEDAAGDGKSEIVDVIKAIAELNNQPDAPERTSGSIDPGLVDVIEAIQARTTQSSAGPDPNVAQLTIQLERLRDELASLGDGVEDVEGTTEALEEQLRSIEDRHERDLSSLGETVDGLEEALASKADRESLAGLESRVDGDQAATRERVDAVEETFEEAYDDIKRILSYLLDASNEHGAMLDVLLDAYESELENLVVAHEDARQLRAVKQEANRRGIGTAICGTCEESFDVSMLAEPRCPHCERDIGGFDAKSSLWRTKYVTEPRQYRPESDHRPVRERVDEALSASESRQDSLSSEQMGSLDDGD